MIMCAVNVMAQKKLTEKDIVGNPAYLYGVGKDANMAKAKNAALEDLVTKISVDVKIDNDVEIVNTVDGQQVSTQERSRQAMQTYSRMSVKNMDYLQTSKNGAKEYAFVCYIKKQDVDKMFEDRANKIRSYAETGVRSERTAKIGTALQSMYCSYLMSGMHPDGQNLTIKDADYQEQNLQMWLPREIKRMLQHLKIAVVSSEKDKEADCQYVQFAVTYDNKPVTDLSFTVSNDGYTSENIVVSEGKASAELPIDANLKKIKCDVDYRGDQEHNVDKELARIIESSQVNFNEASVKPNVEKVKAETAKLAYVPEEAVMVDAQSGEKVRNTAVVHYLDANEATSYLPTAKSIEAALRTRNTKALKELCTDEGWSDVEKLLSYGNARLITTPAINVSILENGDDITLRSFPMTFTFNGSGKRKITENVVFHLNKEAKITQVAFALEKQSVDDIFNNKGNWGDACKQTIVNFLETYKTAFAMKDLDYIDKVFSDKALIIVGRKLTAKDLPATDLNKQRFTLKTSNPLFKFTRLTKEEYMKNLQRSFGSNEYINIKFGDTKIRKRGGLSDSTAKDVFGIQLKQDYFSSTYGDSGYLFLAVDFANPKEPIIHIRTWQPDEDVKGDDVIGLADFD